MSSLFDPTVFERSGSNYVISQRFKHIYNSFSNAFKITLQMFSTNAILQYLPLPVRYFILIFYFFLATALCFLLVNQLRSQRKQEYKDFSLLDPINAKHEVGKRLGSTFLVHLSYVSVHVVVFFFVLNERLGKEYLLFQLFLIILSVIYFLNSAQKR